MADQDDTDSVEPTEPAGPITDAYLHRDVHPDQLPGTKSGHHDPNEPSSLFPKVEEESHPEDLWMYH